MKIDAVLPASFDNSPGQQGAAHSGIFVMQNSLMKLIFEKLHSHSWLTCGLVNGIGTSLFR